MAFIDWLYNRLGGGDEPAPPPQFAPDNPAPSALDRLQELLRASKGILPGQSAGGWGPQNWQPPAADSGFAGALTGDIKDLARGFYSGVIQKPGQALEGGQPLPPEMSPTGAAPGAMDNTRDALDTALMMLGFGRPGTATMGIGPGPRTPRRRGVAPITIESGLPEAATEAAAAARAAPAPEAPRGLLAPEPAMPVPAAPEATRLVAPPGGPFSAENPRVHIGANEPPLEYTMVPEAPRGLLAPEPGAASAAAIEPLPFAEQLRAQHLARPDALPFEGIRAQPITLPAHIQTADDMAGLVSRYVDRVVEGYTGKPWYLQSGEAVLSHAADQPEIATPLTAAFARTSPDTSVPVNAAFGFRAHNQYMAGDPIETGRYPNDMGAAISGYYYDADPVTGRKIGPFQGAIARTWDPTLSPHHFVNDFHNMRLLEFPGPEGAIYTDPGVGTADLYKSSPTTGQHNFARIVSNLAGDEFYRRTGIRLTPEQIQAMGWVGIKSRVEGTTPGEASYDFGDALRQHYAQIPWESAPGMSSGHMPEFHSAPWDLKQQYHNDVLKLLTDEMGRDIISQHIGLLTGPTTQGPGFFKGQSAPGSQAQVVSGQAPTAVGRLVDDSSRALMDTSALVRAIFLQQNATAWLKPIYGKSVPLADRSLFDFQFGRSLTPEENLAVARAMRKETGKSFFAPIGTGQGFRFRNVPEVSGVSNEAFQEAAHRVAGSDILPGEGVTRELASDGFYRANNWRKSPHGQTYTSGLAATGRPDLQRRAADLLAALGPRFRELNARYQRDYGWTPNEAGYIWERPEFQAAGFGQGVIPRPPRPGELQRGGTPLTQKIFGRGGLLPVVGAGGVIGGGLLGPGTAQAAPNQLPPAPANSLDDILRMLGGR